MGSHAAAVFAAGGFLIALRVGKVEFFHGAVCRDDLV